MSDFDFLAWVASIVLILVAVVIVLMFVVVHRMNTNAVEEFKKRTGRTF